MPEALDVRPRFRHPWTALFRLARRVPIWLLILAPCVLAWFPFVPDLPYSQRHGPTVGADGTLLFDGSAALVGPVDPAWVDQATSAGTLRFRLEARSANLAQEGPRRLLALSRDAFEADVMIGQEGPDLYVRVRRPDSDAGGEPALVAPGVFGDGGWHSIELVIDPTSVRLVVDGVVRVDEATPTPALESWQRGVSLALGDEPEGNRAWQGELRAVSAEWPGTTIDVARNADLAPADGVVSDGRLRDLRKVVPDDPIVVTLLRFGAFAALGALLVGRVRWSVLLAAAAIGPLLLTAVKLFVAGRDPVLADAVVSSSAMFVGLARVSIAGLPAYGIRD